MYSGLADGSEPASVNIKYNSSNIFFQHNKTGPELESPGEAKERPTLQQLEA